MWRIPEILKHVLIVKVIARVQNHGTGDYDRIFGHVSKWLKVHNAKIPLVDLKTIAEALQLSVQRRNGFQKLEQLSIFLPPQKPKNGKKMCPL